MPFKGGDRMSEQGSDPFNAEPMPSNDAAEVGALHIRIIALENIIISLLATASDQQLEQAGEMARYISPRPGVTHHPLTTHAAAHMVDLVERAFRFRNGATWRQCRRMGADMTTNYQSLLIWINI
jgi:hypothetical protein